MKNIWGADCGRVSIIGNRVKTVNAKNGKESELYKGLLDHIKDLSEEEKESLKDKYRDWEDKYIHTVDDDKHLALALYAQTTSKNFIEEYKGEKDTNNEPLVNETIQHLSNITPNIDNDKMYSLNTPEALDRIVKGFENTLIPKYLYGTFVGYTTKSGRNIREVSQAINKWISGKPDFENIEVFTSNHGTVNFRDTVTGKMYNIPLDSLEGSKASLETQKMYEEFIKRSGFDIKELTEGLTDSKGDKINANAAVDFVRQLVEVVQDKKETALGEEASHIAVRMIKKNDSILFKQMMNEIDKYDIFGKTVDEYKKDINYQLENGKPNIPKLKEEAIGKVFNELVVKRVDGTNEKPELIAKAQDWWDKVKQFFKNLLNKFGTDFTSNAIEKGAKQFTENSGIFNNNGDEKPIEELKDKKDNESFEQFKDKTISDIKDIANRVPDKTAIVTHSTTMSILKKWLDNGYDETKITQSPNKTIYNGQIIELDINGKKLYVLRHGESDANSRKIDNEKNTPLTDRGVEDSVMIADYLDYLGVKNVISTDTKRTIDTASIIRSRIQLGSVYDRFYQQYKPKGDKIFDKIKSVLVDKKGDEYKVNNEKIKSVTSLANQTIREVTRDFNKQNERIEDFKKEFELGEKNYQDISDIFSRYIDKETGLTNRNEFDKLVSIKDAAISQINPKNSDAYESLEKYIIGYEENATHVNGLLDQYPKDTKFMWNENIYRSGEKGYAANIHFLAIMTDGTTDRLHFGFMDGLRTDKPNADILQWKKDAYTKIISASGNTLKSEYNIDSLRKNRLVPISNQYRYIRGEEKQLSGLKIGDIDFSKIKSDTLLPLPSDVERTGNKQIDTVLDKAYAKIANLERQKKGKTGEEKKNLEEQIKTLEKSLRYYLVKNDINHFSDFGLTYIKNKEEKYKNYIQLLKSGKEDSISTKEINDVSMEFTRVLQDLSIYNNVQQAFKKQYPENTKEFSSLSELHDKAFDLISQIENLRNEWGEKCIANRFNVVNISAPESMVNWLQDNFNPLSAARTKNTQLLFHMVNEVYQRASLDDLVENKKLEEIHNDVQKWLENNSQDKLEKMFFKKQDNGKLSLDPISKLSKKFYEELNKAQKNLDAKWINDNIDTTRYKEDYKQWLLDEENRINNTHFSNDLSLNNEYRGKALELFKEKYDITNYRSAYSIVNDELKKYVIENKWHSDEYKEMKKDSNKSILNLYHYLEGRTKHAYELGALQSWRSILFPQVPKSFVENFTYGMKGNIEGFKNILKGSGRKLTTEKFSAGKVNELTGEKELNLHVAYMKDLGEAIDEKGNKDYSNVSNKIFENISQWNSELSRYKYYSQIEGNVLLIKSIEDNKDHLVTNNFGEPVRKEGGGFEVEKGNKKNADLYKFMMDSGFYGHNKGNEDKGLGGFIAYNKTADKINKFFGYDLLPKSKNEKVFISASNIMRATNQFITYKVLGYNPLTAISNIFGGSMNNYLNAGTHFTRTDFLKSQMRLSSSWLSLPEGKNYTALLKYFNPYTESHSAELIKSLSVNNLQKKLNGLDLMYFMRSSDRTVESMAAMSYFDNTMVENGRLVNIREYVRNQNDIQNLYTGKYTSQQRKDIFSKIEREVEDLKNKSSLPKITKIDENGNISIPDIEQLSDTVGQLRSRIQQVSREALGNRTPMETAKINSTMFGQSLMLFHNWIPALVRKRYQDTAYNPGAGEYQEGRWRMVHSALKGRILSGTKNLIGHMLGNENSEQSLIDIAKKRYAEKVAKFRELDGVQDEGQSMFEKTTPEHRYIENYLNEARAGMFEVLSSLSMLGLFLGYQAFMKPDKNDDYDTRGRYKYAIRTLDKLSDELLFFYSPNSFQQLVSTKVLPAISVLGDIENFVQHGAKEIWYDWSGEETQANKNKSAKYLLRNIPIVNQAVWYTALFWEQFDKDFGISIQAQYQTR